MAEPTLARVSPKLKDITGQRFSRLTVIGLCPPQAGRPRAWLCRCDCGNERRIVGFQLRAGKLKSCGCQRAKNITAGKTVHGRSHTSEHGIWCHMRARCESPTDAAYAKYGGRGITVCDRWRSSFLNFFADMGPRPPGHSLDRIDNDGNYEPGNCRWTTAKVQTSNQRTNRRITALGKTMTAAQWQEATGIRSNTIRSRLDKGWLPDLAVSIYPTHRH